MRFPCGRSACAAFRGLLIKLLSFTGRAALFVKTEDRDCPFSVANRKVERVSGAKFPRWLDAVPVKFDVAAVDSFRCE